MSRLFIRPAAKQNESLLGYLMRLAEENVFDSPLSLVRFAELAHTNDKSSINDFIKAIASGQLNIKKLAAATEEPQSELEMKCYRLLEKGLDAYPDFHLFLNAQVPANFIRFNYPRFCPECMRIDPYHRFYWDYVPLTACPIHKKLLLDVCPNCHKQITWSRSTISKCSGCDYDLFQDSGIDVPEEQMDHIYLIAKVFRKCDATRHKLASFALLQSFQSIANLAYRTSPLPKLLFFEPALKRSILTPLPARSLLSPVSIIKTQDFDDVVIPDPKNDNIHNLKSIRDINEYLVEKLFTQKSTTRLKMRDEFQWQPNAEVHQKMVKFFTGKDVSLLLNYTTYGTLTPQQQARHFGIKNTAYRLPSRMHHSEEIHTSSFERREDIINHINASQHLGISEHLLRKLIKGKILAPLSGPHVDGFGDNLYSIKHIQKFMDSLLSLVEKNPLDEETISLEGYIKTFDISRRNSFVDIVNAIFDRKVKVFDVPSTRLADIVLSLNSVRIFSPQMSMISGYISVKEICSKIGIYTDAIYRTLEAGLLPYRAEGRKKFIRIEDFEYFNEQFIFIKEIASKHKCNATNLADKLIDDGINPVSGPKIDNNLVYIFKREDIENIDIKKIVNKDRYKASTGRIANNAHVFSYHKLINELSLITTTEVAKILDISSQKLGKLLKTDELNLYQHPALPVYKKYVKTSDLNDYIGRYRENTSLISFTAAADFMDESTQRFQSTWVKFNRIEVVNDGLDAKYIDLQRLIELKTFKKNAISIQEASELKGIDRSYFSNQVKLGKIKPVSGPGVDEYGNYFLNRREIEEHTHENWW